MYACKTQDAVVMNNIKMTEYINFLCVLHVLIVSNTHIFPHTASCFAHRYVADEQLPTRFLSGYT